MFSGGNNNTSESFFSNESRSSKDVFTLRKSGQLDEAYHLALELNNRSNSDIWDKRALAWCLIDLIKRDFNSGCRQKLMDYGQCLQNVGVDTDQDNILAQQQARALSLCEPSAPIIFQAKKYSKQKNYAAAIRCYETLLPNLPQENHTNFGWALYYYSKQLHSQGQHTISQIKNNFNLYLKLDVKRPSRLHSCILWLAIQIAKGNNLKLSIFLNLWGLDSFQEEDFERKPAKDGSHQYPALAEEAIQCAIKSSIKSNELKEIKFLFPFLENFLERYPDNVWLVYYMGKALMLLGHMDESRKYFRRVCKRKPNEFWAWMSLGGTYYNNCQTALTCYAKALLCPVEDDKTIKLRIKMAQTLAELGYSQQAKYEISICMQLKPNNIHKELIQLTSQPWFQETVASTSNFDFYSIHAIAAEELLLTDVPWINAVLGDSFTTARSSDKRVQVRRRVYLATKPFPREVSCLAKQFPNLDFPPGSPIRVKGEELQGRPYQILAIAQRDCDKAWDIFSPRIGVISFVNRSKRIYHLLIDRDVESFFHFDKLDSPAYENDFVEVKLAILHDAKGKKVKIVEAKITNKSPNDNIYKSFIDEPITSLREVGFTKSDIFIPPHLVSKNSLTEDSKISGTAILNFNKKKSEWGWKAITIEKKIDPLEILLPS